MNKVELIAAVAEKAGMTKVETRKALDAFLDVAKAELKKDGKIKIAAKKLVKFKAAANILK